MPKIIFPLIVALWAASAYPADESTAANSVNTEHAHADGSDGSRMEKDLQQLNWKQFKSVVEAVPKLKADVDAYGPLGWQYVQANYTTYGWKKSIDKLDDEQKQHLAELIQNAKRAH